jgi:predicted pyridoxine 5'-phosphate oxidase superfamily flavin-nucleotide-binding protein
MTNWTEAFHKNEQAAQQRWGKPAVWDETRIQRLLWDRIPDELHARIEATPFFFLATSNRKGECDCSFKGGGPGLVRMLGEQRLAFPDFDGNQAFMSLGNILDNPQVGLLFIDFSDGARLRVNGHATIHDQGPDLALFEKAKRVVTVDIQQVVPNCAAHVPKLIPATASNPQEGSHE